MRRCNILTESGSVQMDTQADYSEIYAKWDRQKQTVDDLVSRMLMVGAVIEDKSGYGVFISDAEDLFHSFLGDRSLVYRTMNEDELKDFYKNKGGLMGIWNIALQRILKRS